MGAGTSVIPCPEANVPVERDITAELAPKIEWSRELAARYGSNANPQQSLYPKMGCHRRPVLGL